MATDEDQRAILKELIRRDLEQSGVLKQIYEINSLFEEAHIGLEEPTKEQAVAFINALFNRENLDSDQRQEIAQELTNLGIPSEEDTTGPAGD